MKPSVGRIVLFRVVHANGTTEHPAIITRVWSDACVNLLVFIDGGVPEPRSSVVHKEYVEGGLDTHNWRWPPRGEA